MCDRDLTFNGETYVAYSDLCGFKEMMKKRREAYEALDRLFNGAFRLCRERPSVRALAVSDCVISWAMDGQLSGVLELTKLLHKDMIERRWLMRTAIAFGDFRYQDRIQLPNLGKDMIIGGAYLDAVIANEEAEAGMIVLVGEASRQLGLLSTQMWRESRKPRGKEYFWSTDDNEKIDLIVRDRKQCDRARWEWLKDVYAGNFHRS